MRTTEIRIIVTIKAVSQTLTWYAVASLYFNFMLYVREFATQWCLFVTVDAANSESSTDNSPLALADDHRHCEFLLPRMLDGIEPERKVREVIGGPR